MGRESQHSLTNIAKSILRDAETICSSQGVDTNQNVGGLSFIVVRSHVIIVSAARKLRACARLYNIPFPV